VSFNPCAKENNVVIIDKLIPRNVRLANSNSSGKEFAPAEKTINFFLRKWSIAGASVAISKDGKLIFARGFGYADTASLTETQPYSQFRAQCINTLHISWQQ